MNSNYEISEKRGYDNVLHSPTSSPTSSPKHEKKIRTISEYVLRSQERVVSAFEDLDNIFKREQQRNLSNEEQELEQLFAHLSLNETVEKMVEGMEDFRANHEDTSYSWRSSLFSGFSHFLDKQIEQGKTTVAYVKEIFQNEKFEELKKLLSRTLLVRGFMRCMDSEPSNLEKVLG